MLRHSLPPLHPQSPAICWQKAADKGNGMGAGQSKGGGELEGREDPVLEEEERRFVHEVRSCGRPKEEKRRRLPAIRTRSIFFSPSISS